MLLLVVSGCDAHRDSEDWPPVADDTDVAADTEVAAETDIPADTDPIDTLGDWTPADIPNLDLYLDADLGVVVDGGVASWTDQGPHARELIQSDPTHRPTLVANGFGEVPAVRFSHQWLSLAPSELPGGSSIFAVVRWTAATDVVPPPGNIANVPLTLVGDTTSGYGSFGAAGGAVMSNHYVGGPVYVAGGEGLNDGAPHLVGAIVDPTAMVQIFVGNLQVRPDEFSAPLAGANSYDTIGAGAHGLDGWEGDVGAVVIVGGTIGVGDRTKLDTWAHRRFGTPLSARLDTWTREPLATLPDAWLGRDGAQMVELASGRILMIGGWNPYDPWGGYRQTNEVWASDDRGASWTLLLPHDDEPPKSGPGARFPTGHTVGVTTHGGHALVIGDDCNRPPYTGDVWAESDDGTTWTRISTDAPSQGRCLFMVATLGDDVYLMGGQTNMYDQGTAIADVWRSSDGGVTWDELDTPPWSGRGMNYRPVELDGKLYVVGGGRYDQVDVVAFNGVFAFDGTTWTTVLPDGHDQWEATYYNAEAALDGRLWLFNGYTGVDEVSRALFSDDHGLTWAILPGGSGGKKSHADDVLGLDDRILRVSGYLDERTVWAFRP